MDIINLPESSSSAVSEFPPVSEGPAPHHLFQPEDRVLGSSELFFFVVFFTKKPEIPPKITFYIHFTGDFRQKSKKNQDPTSEEDTVEDEDDYGTTNDNSRWTLNGQSQESNNLSSPQPNKLKRRRRRLFP